MSRPLVAAVLLLAASCGDGGEVVYDQYNADDDTVEIAIGEELLDPVSIDLHSTSGELVIGTAEIDPGGGPVGTEHTLVVDIDDDYQDIVDRVSVRTSSPDRGEDEYDLVVDSADEGLYVITLVTVGEEGESRTDELTFRVWDAEDTSDEE